MIAYKLLRVRKDGSLGSLFINKGEKIPIGVWLQAESHPTEGFLKRVGWHCMSNPSAPHLSMRGRKWFKVEVMDYNHVFRPESQGGLWYIAQRMKVLGPI
jgi:hypothetical protein